MISENGDGRFWLNTQHTHTRRWWTTECALLCRAHTVRPKASKPFFCHRWGIRERWPTAIFRIIPFEILIFSQRYFIALDFDYLIGENKCLLTICDSLTRAQIAFHCELAVSVEPAENDFAFEYQQSKFFFFNFLVNNYSGAPCKCLTQRSRDNIFNFWQVFLFARKWQIESVSISLKLCISHQRSYQSDRPWTVSSCSIGQKTNYCVHNLPLAPPPIRS